MNAPIPINTAGELVLAQTLAADRGTYVTNVLRDLKQRGYHIVATGSVAGQKASALTKADAERYRAERAAEGFTAFPMPAAKQVPCHDVADRISAHEIRVVEVMRNSERWHTAREIAVAADMKDRTARARASALTSIGVFEVSKLFGGYRYRFCRQASTTAASYMARLDHAKRAFGEA